jgi:hypothetical protein
MPPRSPWIRRGQHGYAAFMAGPIEGRVVLQPFETSWALGCPVVGPDERALARELAPEFPDAALMLSGLELESRRMGALAKALEPRFRLLVGPVTTRRIASLEGGLDGFLSRRSPAFRRSLVKARRRAADAGLVIEPHRGDVAEGFARLLAVDDATWKGAESAGIRASQTAEFYRLMAERLAARGALWLSFARLGGADAGYILGGTLGDTYRGLQFGYVREHERLSLGNLLQLHELERLAQQGIRRYDLGTEYPYKVRWGEEVQATVTLFALPHRPRDIVAG